MVNDSCFLLIELNPTLTAQLAKRVTCRDPRDAWLSPWGWAWAKLRHCPGILMIHSSSHPRALQHCQLDQLVAFDRKSNLAPWTTAW